MTRTSRTTARPAANFTGKPPELNFLRHRPGRPDTENAASRPGFNDAESPLSWLRSRRDNGGRPLISDEQYLAGEKLRSDFERSMMMGRMTVNWDATGAGTAGGNGTAEFSDAAIAAGQRYHNALDAIGPELGGIAIQVCCMAAGLEQAERVLALPKRSGKAVLGLALTGLARHYGLLAAARAPSRGEAWRMPGCRPEIQLLEDA